MRGNPTNPYTIDELPSGRMRQRGLRPSDTALLILVGDILGVLAVAAVIWPNWNAIRKALPAEWFWVGASGASFIFLRIVALFFMLQAPGRILDAVLAASRTGLSSTVSADEDSLVNQPDAKSRRGEQATEYIDFKLHWLYCLFVALGIIGYLLVVTVTGGPFASPIASLFFASLFLGQVRANTTPSFVLLAVYSVFFAALSLVVADNSVHGWIDYRAGNQTGAIFTGLYYLPPFGVVAFITSGVNFSTLFFKPRIVQDGVVVPVVGPDATAEAPTSATSTAEDPSQPSPP